MAEPATVQDYLNQPQAKADVRIAYGVEPAQIVDLFLPKGPGKHPVVVLIHGGCYLAQYQGLPQTSGLAADLAKRGYAVWNVEYRKLGEAGAGYPGTFLDVADAVDRIRAEAPKYKLDTTRVVALGHSAGGHLALWAASRARLPKTSPLWRRDPLKISTVISLGGIGDLEGQGDVFAGACGPEPIPKIIGLADRKDAYADTSPAALLPSGARVLMISGELDHVMPPATGHVYVTRVRKAGDSAEAVAIPGATHYDVVIPTTTAWKQVADTVTREIGKLR
ncbi:MAG: alpha/beta hydrolase [Alphaproteobacteria bacterium]|nr:alpha/beta hydrolase [Alphaproteobacteria bacterium]MBU1513590.1 alpha/beta hydrolase [Alphaproteobacteria bacterium]MBU2094765.1 alpha/beta hydrolase [Alphaproteobacteria bacterium]MBU2150166.1 alpha/beta hydrolase [Alphaproteobacteria bacterium]MBU2309305.1 alpha/beta hydrolase [Alphaproteobacteria bacterium]